MGAFTPRGLCSAALFGLALVCAACTEEASHPPEKAAAAEATSKAAPTPDERLALQKTVGAADVDRLIDAAAARAQKNPESADAWVVLGRAWVRKARESADPGYYLNAKACAAIVRRSDPESRLAKNLELLVLLNGHEFAAARALAKSLVERAPDDAMALGSLSDAELELGLYEDAAVHAQAMIDLKPNLPSYARASFLSWIRGDTAGAKEAIRAAIDAGRDKHDPEPRAWVLVQAANIFLAEGDLDGAGAGYDMTLDWLPGYAPALVGKGRVALAKGDGRAAVESLERAYAASPLVETAWLLGDAHALAKSPEAAEKAYAKVRADGKVQDPRTLSLFLTARGESPDLALTLAEQEHAARKDVVTEEALAMALFRKGRVAEAKVKMMHARRLGTPDPRALAHEGLIRLAAGDKAAGRAALAKALTNPTVDRATRDEATRVLEPRP